MKDLILLIVITYMCNWGIICFTFIDDTDNYGPLTKIITEDTTSKEIFAQKFLIWTIPIYTPWTIIYGFYRFIKWYKKLPEL